MSKTTRTDDWLDPQGRLREEAQGPPAVGRAAPDTVERAAPNTAVPRAGHAPAGPRDLGWPTVSGYEVLAGLGRGSMGVVYKARDVRLNRLVALKMIRPDLSADGDALDRFVEEARLVASLQHPNIIQIYEVRIDGPLPFFSMELVEGGGLADWIGGRPQPVRAAARLVETLARAIHVAHEKGVVHRDLKPANVLLAGAEGSGALLRPFADELAAPHPEAFRLTPKITDFGLAKQLRGGAGRTESGVVLGTPSYMAPEQAEGRSRDVGPTADVYALGAILYECLTGRPPFAAESPLETVLQLFQMEPVAPSRLQPKVPRDLETICLKCLQKEPRRRYGSGLELAEDLHRFLGDEPILARPTSFAERAWRAARRRPAVATLAAAAVVAVLGLAASAAWHQYDLGSRLDRALDDERVASEQVRVAALRGRVNDLLREGEAAVALRDWQAARERLLAARDRTGEEPELGDLRARVDDLIGQTERQRQDRERLEQFRRRRDDALFHGALFSGIDLDSGLEETRSAALDALGLFGAGPESSGAPAADSPHYEEWEKAEVVAGCYEMLLVLADVTARAAPGESAEEQRRRAGQALRILDRAARLGPSTGAYHRRRAECLARAGDAEESKRAAQRAESAPPGGALDAFLLGTEQYLRDDLKSAATYFETALQSRPDYYWAEYYLALCLLKTHQPELAAARVTACLGSHPGLPWLHLLRGSAWAEAGRLARAEEDFEAALEGPLPDPARYGLYVNRGVLCVRQGRPAEATEHLRKAIELRPRQYQAYANLAQALLAENKLDEAVRQLDTAVECEPRLAELRRTRARVHLLRKDLPAALADFRAAVGLAAVAADHVECGRILQRLGDHESAVAAYDAALEERPDDVRTHRLRAEALLELERLPEALRSLDACVRHGPPDAGVFRARSLVRTRLGQYPGAQADCTRALELAPDAATFAARGWAYLAAKSPALALPDFEQALRLDSALADAHAGRGAALAQLGRPRQAVADAEEGLRLGPASPRLLYAAARVYAQAAARADAASERDERQAAYLRAEWQGRALRLLRQALEGQPAADALRFWQKYVQGDDALSSVRPTAGFRRLAEEFSRPTR